ncbi:hypothetical protein ACT80S_14375 [Ramlibacter sp. MAHUQ-53]|uniref:hypothetical protein n=1 Tax=unclassified Ramlibacter TaxID=2617605 RepID=UPI00362BE2EA
MPPSLHDWRPKPRGHRLVVGLDARGAAWQAPGEAQVRTGDHAGLGAALAALSAMPGATVASVQLVAGADIAVHWVLAPPAVAHLAELRQVAQARCAGLFGGSAASWRVTGDWSAQHPFACAGLDATRAAAVERSLAPLRVPVHWQTAWGLLARHAAHAFPADGWSVLRSPSRLLVWQCRAGRPHTLTGLPAAPGASPEALAAQAWGHVRLESARVPPGEAGPGPLHWLDLCTGQAPQAEGIVQAAVPGTAAAGVVDEAGAALALARRLQGSRR